ncbi:NADH:flavin oxidoreductase/NADH oxidase [Paenibacillus mucilaginosus 3016]|uniref:NADH:flavin oxidoreductase/NADH oxidase n=1 Tax=Paenibacillus mucilaginosus 3016 TaxID=1116391 RepID=H6NMR7_9BACL|nr:alkene reductase [Paenibacillus mucilaginosus]AFC30404.1 NADH:flavin oxidoreductase/NADH oxidase [Paenibacillus mucilaginosus 3016]WFA19045.1 alkene reductase [Paenibacillus mucilaginosus]
MSNDVFEPVQLGDLTLANRMVMAPMTRNRADVNGVVTPMMVTYYQQRATAGLIITESVPVSPEAVGYPFTPGIYTDTQAVSWLCVTDAVHSAGGRIFLQLQHCGRISHPSLQPDNATPVAPSALRPEGQVYTYSGKHDFVTPRALETSEIPKIVAQFKRAAELAKHAGFDGVEVHGANGYVIDQFLRDGSNLRTDAYGGSVQNRMRLLNEVLDAVCTVWQAQRVGVRLTPENRFNSMSDSSPQMHFSYFIKQLSKRGLAYVHVLEGDMMAKNSELDYRALRSKFSGLYIANNGYDLVRAQTAVRSGDADLVAFGTPFLANPDLVRRYRENLPLNEADQATFYQGGEAGYIDYPFYRDEEE